MTSAKRDVRRLIGSHPGQGVGSSLSYFQHIIPASLYFKEQTLISPLALALATTDVWEGHAGQTQATSSRMQNP
jgi:hypothetical protein